ncbi:transcription repressor OFP14 [Ziziphus jujuba]|uniref:Transcription repressor n=1 Tax=Ziziphus jujuba TaxID=326968 RepID=A0A6P3YTZ8_ZIZJJ|nr:transcription repressor OFP14 [Ziziphus jujuba]
MPKKLQKTFQDYLSKIKKPTPQNISTTFSSSKSFILSGCKHQPKTLSFAIDRKQHDHQEAREDSDSATLSDIDRFLFENFKSLYIKDDEDKEEEININKKKKGNEEPHHENENQGGFLFESPRLVDPPTDLCGSHRFFVAPVLSSSLIEESRRLSLTTSSSEFDVVVSGGSGSSSSTTSTGTINESASMDSNHATTKEDNIIAKEVSLPDNCIAVLTYSPCPQDEFRRSMHEMIEARLRHHQKVDWVFMEELLFSYLNLNEKKSHKYILSAFVDLIVVLRQRSNDRVQAAARSRNVRSSRERRKKVRQVT